MQFIIAINNIIVNVNIRDENHNRGQRRGERDGGGEGVVGKGTGATWTTKHVHQKIHMFTYKQASRSL